MILLLLVTVPVLYRLPPGRFEHRYFAPALVILDTILISASITLNRQSPWDLLLVFFFGLFIAAIGESLIKIVAGCVLIGFASLVIHPSSSSMSFPYVDAEILFRIPFLFGVSILYAYLAEQARQEKEKGKRAEETAQWKGQIVSALAHDIKNPFSVIMGYAEIALEELKEGRPNSIHDALQRIQDNPERVMKLINGFQDASKFESGKVELARQPVQLNLLVADVRGQLLAQAEKKEIFLTMDLGDRLPAITGDSAQIDRTLWNLIGNAIKFTPKGGTITIKTWQEAGQVCASVSDTGIGIAKEELASLFGEFHRLKGASKVEGSGLGLFIAKKIVEAHGGNIGAHSEEGRGSTFTIRFPVRNQEIHEPGVL